MIYLVSIAVFVGLLAALALFLIAAERFLLDYGICKVSVNAGERVLVPGLKCQPSSRLHRTMADSRRDPFGAPARTARRSLGT